MAETATFVDLRTRLEDALAELARLGEERESARLASGATGLAEKLARERFVVAVLGEFKRGKSTFINAVLGEELLPTGVVPLTSVITQVGHGDARGAEIVFRDGRRQSIPPEEIAHYVTERHNPANRLKVHRAIVRHPAPDLADGVLLVDTPGVGSIHAHNTEATRGFLAEVDAAIFVTSVDPPISHAEREFLGEARAEASRLFFVLNKADYLSDPDLEEAIRFSRDVLAEVIGGPVVLYALSALNALRAKDRGDDGALEASGLPAFERDFRAFLVHEKGKTIIASVAASADRLAADELNSITVEQEATRLPAEELSRRKEAIEQVFAEAERSQHDLAALLSMEIRTLVSAVEGDLAELREAETARLLAETGELVQHHVRPRTAGEEVDRRVKESLRETIEHWRLDEEEKVADAFRRATRRFVEQADGLVRHTIELCSELLDVGLASVAAADSLEAESEFTYAFFDPPGSIEATVERVRRGLPAPLARKMLWRNLEEAIPILVDKHCGRLRWDLVQRLERSRLALERDLEEHLEAAADGLRRGVERAEARRASSQQEAESAAAGLSAAGRRLAHLREVLGAVAGAVA